MTNGKDFEVAVIVAHPDDETLWAGGTILMGQGWNTTVLSLCRGSDPDRAPKFAKAVRELGATGAMADLDDDPEQLPLDQQPIRRTILSMLPQKGFDLVLTHSPFGEYTRHRRHEETGQAVAALWHAGDIRASEMRMFAYRDEGKGGIEDAATPIKKAHLQTVLPESIWRNKIHIITQTYGFNPNSYEAKIAQKQESFWRFHSAPEYDYWFKKTRRLS